MAFESQAGAGVETGVQCRECGTWHAAAALCPRCALAFALDDGNEDSGSEATLQGEPAVTPDAAPPPPLKFAHFTLEHDAAGHPVELGRGGMGVTYLATDRHLHIKVALKVIAPARVGDRAAQALFFREARAAAKVRHSHVASVLYLSEPPGNVFYAMEFVPGESLRRWIERHAPVPPLLSISLAEQIARGLGAIHHEGIVHRDLKPGNVMLVPAPRSSTAGPPDPLSPDAWHAKIIDFGLARAVAKEDEYVSTIGFRGTALYASPEQCEERHDLDGRADLYSLGCILFELLTGSPPFKARTHRELMNLHVSSAPPLERLEHLPASLTAIVARLLVKDPEDRFADADALVKALLWACGKIEQDELVLDKALIPLPDRTNPPAASRPAAPAPGEPNPFAPTPELSRSPSNLREFIRPRFRFLRSRPRFFLALTATCLVLTIAFVWWTYHTTTHSLPSDPPASTLSRGIAVLPFANLSPGPQNAFLSDGIHEDILTNLAKIRDFKVISRTSVLVFQAGEARDLGKIAGSLGVGAILEGSVRREGRQLRVTARLFDARSGIPLWAETFDREITDLFVIQGQIAVEIARALKTNLTPAEKAKLEQVPTGQTAAYERFIQARSILADSSSPRISLDQALEYLRAALEIDPSFAPAHALLANVHTLFYAWGRDHTDQRLFLALQSAETAVRLNPNLADARVALGNYYYRGLRDYPRALECFQQALALAPSNADALIAVGLMERRRGNWEIAEQNLAAAIPYNPLDAVLRYNLVATRLYLRRFEAAEVALDEASRRIGPHILLQRVRGHLYLHWKGDLQPMRDDIASRTDRMGTIEMNTYDRVHLLLLEHRFDEALATLEKSHYVLSDGQLLYVTREALHAEILTQAGRSAEAAPLWAKERDQIARLATSRPDDPRLQTALAYACAGSGDPEAALEAARRAVSLSPVEKDAFDGPFFLQAQALVQIRAGRIDEARRNVQALLAMPAEFSPNLLRISPVWQGLPPL